MTTLDHTWQVRDLRTRLINLIDDVGDRLTHDDQANCQTLLEKLLDRLVDLAESVTDQVLCTRCANPATHLVEAGTLGTRCYRAEIVCAACIRPSSRWASVHGPARVKRINPDTTRITWDGHP